MFAHGFVYTAVHLVSSEVVSNTMKNIYESINGINENDIPHITDLLERLDIKKKIEITESLFKENKNIKNDTLKIALNNLHQITIKIKSELEEIGKDIEYSKTLYFQSFRTLPYMEKLEKLKNHNELLDNRLDLTIKLLSSNKK